MQHKIQKRSAIFNPFSFAALCLIICTTAAISAQTDWVKLDDGLELGRFKVTQFAPYGDSTITVLRIDPRKWNLQCMGISQSGDSCLTAQEWCKKYNLVGAVNAGMYEMNYRTHTGFMQTKGHVNNKGTNIYQSFAAFDPKKKGIPPFRIFDRESTSIKQVLESYGTVIQNLRLIKRSGENRWHQQDQKWSDVALGEDSAGRVLFIYCRSPYTMHDFNRLLLSLPLDLVCAQHLEGGPEAQLYISVDSTRIELVGSYETDFNLNDNNSHAWPIPNIIGIARVKEHDSK